MASRFHISLTVVHFFRRGHGSSVIWWFGGVVLAKWVEISVVVDWVGWDWCGFWSSGSCSGGDGRGSWWGHAWWRWAWSLCGEIGWLMAKVSGFWLSVGSNGVSDRVGSNGVLLWIFDGVDSDWLDFGWILDSAWLDFGFWTQIGSFGLVWWWCGGDCGG